MAGYQTKYLTQRLDDMGESERNEVLNHLLGSAANSVAERRKEIEIEMMTEYYDAIKEQFDNFGKVNGLFTNNWVLDRMTMGLAPGEVTIVGGPTSNGKTILAINIAAEIAKQGKNVLFITLEMTKEELGVRFMKVMGNDFETYMSNIFFQKNDELNWKSVDAIMEKAKNEANVDLVIIDHLHYFTREMKNVAEDIGNITKEFKKNAIRHKLPVILISHTRKSEKSNNTKAGINDLRGSSFIAQDADIVLMVYRDEDFKDKIFVSLEKNRNRYGCPVGSEYQFDFRDLKIIEPTFNKNFGK